MKIHKNKHRRQPSKKKKRAFLVGPFIGELSWEYYRFAPYIIHLKKEHPNIKIILFTRPSRFDLYGTYMDVMVPLSLRGNKKKNECGFTISGFSHDNYDMLAKLFRKKYCERYKIIEHIYPDIITHYYKLKWQYPRDLMNYSFKPRKKNREIVRKFMKPGQYLFDGVSDHKNFTTYEVKYISVLSTQIDNFVDDITCTKLGCFIEAIKMCKLVAGNLSSDVCRLALLLKKPVIAINETMSDDSIHLINPFKTPVIKASSIKEGVKCYEDNF